MASIFRRMNHRPRASVFRWRTSQFNLFRGIRELRDCANALVFTEPPQHIHRTVAANTLVGWETAPVAGVPTGSVLPPSQRPCHRTRLRDDRWIAPHDAQIRG